MEIRNEFVKRISEINSFYEILRIIEFEKPKISGFNIDEDEVENLIIDNYKIDTLRSTSYLLLYNLIESTIEKYQYLLEKVLIASSHAMNR